MWVFQRNVNNSCESAKKSDVYYSALSRSNTTTTKGNPGKYSRKMHVLLGILLFGIFYLIINAYSLRSAVDNNNGPMIQQPVENYVKKNSPVEVIEENVITKKEKPIVWVYGQNTYNDHLKHVFAVFEKIGFLVHYGPEPLPEGWDVLWSHEYPFRALSEEMSHLKSHQKVNHFPGSGYITNKLSLSSSKVKYIPPAFSLPAERKEFLDYVGKPENSAKMWVQKDGNHRGIEVRKVSELNLERGGSFIQQYIHNPFLIDGHKFDIGVYVTLTGINPMRVYVYETDVLLRFCMDKYYPFDSRNLASYVVGDDYLPVWKVPSLKDYYTKLNYTFKDSLKAYIESQGKSFDHIWANINDAIRKIYLEKAQPLVTSTSQYSSSRNFFELVRFDFILDEDLNVFIMEANMSPNLSSLHFSQNKLLYEQVIFNTLSVVGLVKYASGMKFDEMQVSDRDIQVNYEHCHSSTCLSTCSQLECKICNRCLSSDFKDSLLDAYLEHLSRWNTRRIIPKQFVPSHVNWSHLDTRVETPYQKDALLQIWFQGKCLQDNSWCN